jgi:hypothetical protein
MSDTRPQNCIWRRRPQVKPSRPFTRILSPGIQRNYFKEIRGRRQLCSHGYATESLN